VADKKIPLLTEIYQPKPRTEAESKVKQDDPTLGITPELISRITGHVRPRLEAEITQSVLESVREVLKKDLIKELQVEIRNAQALLEANTRDFVDKTKADLKTELPRMYQASADLVQVELADKVSALVADATSGFEAKLDETLQVAEQAAITHINSHVEALQSDTGARIADELNQQMSAFQLQSLSDHQSQLDEALQNIFQSINQNAQTELQHQLEFMQSAALTQMRTTFNEAMPAIYTAAVADQQEAITDQISQRLNQEMQIFQEQTFSNHQAQLREGLMNIFQSVNNQAKTDLHQQMDLIQADALKQMRDTINEALPTIYTAAAEEMRDKFDDEMTKQSMLVRENFLSTINADLPVVQEVMRENIQQVLAMALPTLENDLRKQLTAELQDLLLKVKFVLPK